MPTDQKASEQRVFLAAFLQLMMQRTQSERFFLCLVSIAYDLTVSSSASVLQKHVI